MTSPAFPADIRGFPGERLGGWVCVRTWEATPELTRKEVWRGVDPRRADPTWAFREFTAEGATVAVFGTRTAAASYLRGKMGFDPISLERWQAMGFRSDRQRGQVARALLGLVGLERLWTDSGPTDEALVVLEKGVGPWGSGGNFLARLAFDVWNGQGAATFGDALGSLDRRNLSAVGELLSAVAADPSGAAVDGWLATYAAPLP